MRACVPGCVYRWGREEALHSGIDKKINLLFNTNERDRDRETKRQRCLVGTKRTANLDKARPHSRQKNKIYGTLVENKLVEE